MFKTKLAGLSSQKKRILLIALVVLAGLVLAGLVANRKNETEDKGKVIFVIDGENYYERDLEPVIKYTENRGLGKNKAAKEAFELYKKINVAEKLNINPTEEEIQSEKQKLIDETAGDYNQSDDEAWIDLLAKTYAIDRYITHESSKHYKGYYFDVFFGQHIQHGPTFKPEGLNDKNLIEADKRYAEERINFYHKQLKDGQMNPDQIIEELKTDPKLKTEYGSKTSFASSFGHTEESWESDIYYEPISNFIAQQADAGISDVQIGQASVDSTPDNFGDMYYYFVLIDEIYDTRKISPDVFSETLKNLATEYIGYDS